MRIEEKLSEDKDYDKSKNNGEDYSTHLLTGQDNIRIHHMKEEKTTELR